MHERLRLERRAIDPRPALPDEVGQAFQARTVRIPVLAERATAQKELFVTDEVVVERRRARAESREAPVSRPREQPEPVEVAGVQVEPLREPLLEPVTKSLAQARRMVEDIRAGWRRARRAEGVEGAEAAE